MERSVKWAGLGNGTTYNLALIGELADGVYSDLAFPTAQVP